MHPPLWTVAAQCLNEHSIVQMSLASDLCAHGNSDWLLGAGTPNESVADVLVRMRQVVSITGPHPLLSSANFFTQP